MLHGKGVEIQYFICNLTFKSPISCCLSIDDLFINLQSFYIFATFISTTQHGFFNTLNFHLLTFYSFKLLYKFRNHAGPCWKEEKKVPSLVIYEFYNIMDLNFMQKHIYFQLIWNCLNITM